MVTYVNITGYDEFVKYVENLSSEDVQLYFYFSGSKDSRGVSWCPDCVEAEPVVKAYLSELNRNIVFAYVDVGDREYYYKDSPIFTNGDREYSKLPVCFTFYPKSLKTEVFCVCVDSTSLCEYGWKDRNCPFRTDNRTKLMVIPTIIKWKGVQRLEGSQCNKRELLEMMFTDED